MQYFYAVCVFAMPDSCEPYSRQGKDVWQGKDMFLKALELTCTKDRKTHMAVLKMFTN